MADEQVRAVGQLGGNHAHRLRLVPPHPVERDRLPAGIERQGRRPILDIAGEMVADGIVEQHRGVA